MALLKNGIRPEVSLIYLLPSNFTKPSQNDNLDDSDNHVVVWYTIPLYFTLYSIYVRTLEHNVSNYWYLSYPLIRVILQSSKYIKKLFKCSVSVYTTPWVGAETYHLPTYQPPIHHRHYTSIHIIGLAVKWQGDRISEFRLNGALCLCLSATIMRKEERRRQLLAKYSQTFFCPIFRE